MDILKTDGGPCTRERRGLKLRICDVFKEPGCGAADFMGNELKKLTEADLADLRTWFEEQGYPCN